MPFQHPIEVRFMDLDPLDHVNHAVLVSYLEQARWQWWRAYLGGRPFSDEGFLIVRLEVDYRRPILMGEEVQVELRCSRLGRTSFDLAYRVLADGALAAEGRTVQVMLDFEAGRPKALSSEVRAWIETQGGPA